MEHALEKYKDGFLGDLQIIAEIEIGLLSVCKTARESPGKKQIPKREMKIR